MKTEDAATVFLQQIDAHKDLINGLRIDDYCLLKMMDFFWKKRKTSKTVATDFEAMQLFGIGFAQYGIALGAQVHPKCGAAENGLRCLALGTRNLLALES